MNGRLIKIFAIIFTAVILFGGLPVSASSVPETGAQFVIVATAGEGGAINPSGRVRVAGGESKKFSVTPDADYHIGGIYVDGVFRGIYGSHTFTNIKSNHTIEVIFEPDDENAPPPPTPTPGIFATPSPTPFNVFVPTPTPTPSPLIADPNDNRRNPFLEETDETAPVYVPIPEPAEIETTEPIEVVELPTGQTEPDVLTSTFIPRGAIAITLQSNAPRANADGSFTVPEGGTVVTSGGAEISLPLSFSVAADGALSFEDRIPNVIEIKYLGHRFAARNLTALRLDETSGYGYAVRANNPFADVSPSDWHHPYVVFVYAHRLMSGVGGEPAEFDPASPITRGMIVTLLYKIAGAPAVGNLLNPYEDVEAGAWYENAVKWAASVGILNVLEGGLFNPEILVDRQDLMIIFDRYAGIAGITFPMKRDYEFFADEEYIEDYARSSVRRFFCAGIVNGQEHNMFNPRGDATRAEIAAMIYRLLEAAVAVG